MSIEQDIKDAAGHLKDAAAKAGDQLKHTGDKLKHTVDEQLHRGAAEAEHQKRDLIGKELSPEEKVKSVANEAKQTAQAGVDAFKKKLD